MYIGINYNYTYNNKMIDIYGNTTTYAHLRFDDILWATYDEKVIKNLINFSIYFLNKT